MKKNRIKIIFISTLFILTISIITCLLLTKETKISNNPNKNFTPIINLESIVKDANEKREEEQRKNEEEARLQAEEEARLQAEEEARLQAEEKARLQAEEKARLQAEEKRKNEEAKRIAEKNKIKNEEHKKTQTNNIVNNIDCSKPDNYQKELLCYVNKARVEHGLKELTLNNELSNSANIRANEIKTSFAHSRPNGKSYSSVINITHRYSGENIAAGQTNTKQVFDAWMNSPGHRANILSPNYTQMGISLEIDSSARYKYYWAQLFIS